MRIVFFGTPLYVVPVVDNLYKAFKSKSGETPIVAVVTQEPKPTGRKQLVEYSPVDSWAHKKGVPIYFDANKLLEDRIEADLGVLASYGAIIPQEVIDYFPNGILNIHPSLLPKYRGSSPVQAAILSADILTGSTIMQLDEKLDHGPIVAQFKEEINDEDTTLTLRDRLFERSAEILAGLIPAYLSGKINLKEQDHKLATFTRQIRKEHAYIKPEYLHAAMLGQNQQEEWPIPFIKDYTTHYSPLTIRQFIRAMQPWPIAWTKVTLLKNSDSKRLLLHKAHVENGKITLDEVQLEGKGVVSWKQFIDGYPNNNLIATHY